MTKDYKTPKKKAQQKKEASIGWVSLIIGMVIGLVIGLGFYLYNELSKPQVAEIVSPSAPAVSKEQPPVTTSEAESSEPEKSRFDFYRLLPEMEIFIPEQEEEAQLRLPKMKRPGSYVLQVGSFKHFSDADAFKAQLALQGFESRIQSVTIDSDTTWHRVRIGPIKDMQKLNQTRAKLRRDDIEFMLLKIKAD